MKKILLVVVILSTIIVLLILALSTSIYAELIDGPANIRETPNGKVLFSLYNDLSVQCKAYNEN